MLGSGINIFPGMRCYIGNKVINATNTNATLMLGFTIYVNFLKVKNQMSDEPALLHTFLACKFAARLGEVPNVLQCNTGLFLNFRNSLVFSSG